MTIQTRDYAIRFEPKRGEDPLSLGFKLKPDELPSGKIESLWQAIQSMWPEAIFLGLMKTTVESVHWLPGYPTRRLNAEDQVSA